MSTAAAPTGVPRQRWSSLAGLRGWLLLLAYLVLGGLLLRPVLEHARSQIWSRFDDVHLFAFWLAWGERWLTHGGDPFRTAALATPHGTDALWNPALFGLSIPAAPVTAVAGPYVAYSVLTAIAPALNAWAGALLAARWVRPVPAALAGLVLGFGGYVLGQAQGHLNLVWTVYPCALLALLVDVRRGRGPRRAGLLLAALTVWQFFVCQEVLATTAVFVAVLLVATALLAGPRLLVRARPLGTSLAVGAVVTGVLLAYPAFRMLRSPDRPTTVLRDPRVYNADLANLLVPTRTALWHPFAGVAGNFGANVTENGLYLGLPLLLVAIVAVVWIRRPVTRVLGVTGLVMLVLALGPRLRVDGRLSRWPLPGAVLTRIPLVAQAEPMRLSLYVLICAALLAGFAVDRALELALPARLGAGALGLLTAATLFPAAAVPTALAVPTFFTSGAADAIPAGSLARTVPRASAAPVSGPARPMGWQAETLLRYRTTGGYVIGRKPPVDAFDGAAGKVAAGVPVGRAATAAACAALRGTATSDVLVLDALPRAAAVRAWVGRTTGVPGHDTGGITMFDVRAGRCG